MLRDSGTSGLSSYSKKTGRARRKGSGWRSRRAVFLVSVALVIVIIVSIGVVAKWESGRSTHTVVSTKSLKLEFAASFTGHVLDTSVWSTCYPWATGGTGCTNYGNSDEKEWYEASQDRVSDGALDLVAQHKLTQGFTSTGGPKVYACRSGMVTTYPSFSFEYGLVQIVAKIPFDEGLWSALWLAAANKKWPPEIDLLEHWNNAAQSGAYLHPTSGIRQGGRVSTPGLSAGWHTFTLKWTKTQLIWYYDGSVILSTSNAIPHQAMYLIMNLANISTSAGACNGTMAIKSVKVWQL
jgi:beta-glucanase (GH16 family)